MSDQPAFPEKGWWRKQEDLLAAWERLSRSGKPAPDIQLPELELARWTVKELTIEPSKGRRELLYAFGELVLRAAHNPDYTGSDRSLTHGAYGHWTRFKQALEAHRRFTNNARLLIKG